MKSRLPFKSYRPGRYELLAIVLIIIATTARLILIANNWPTTNSDEGNMGLLARHVAYNGEWPIFFYGLPYMGPVEGYIAAPLFHLFGPSLFTLRLALLPLYFFYMLTMFYLVRMLYSERLALFSIILLSLGSNELFVRNLRAVGEYPETLLFTALIMLVTSWLALTSAQLEHQRQTPDWRRLGAYTFLGLIIGQGIWVDLLVLPFVLCGGILLFVFCRRELLTRASLGLIIGFIIGAMPLIIYNLTAPIQENSLAVLLSIHGGHQGELAGIPVGMQWLMKLVGTFVISLPYGTGISPVCSLNDTIVFSAQPQASCMLIQGGWALGYIFLWSVATIGASRFIIRKWKGQKLLFPSWDDEERREVILQFSRLMLLGSALITLLLYMISPSAATYPFTSTRYLTGLLIAIPAVLWPLWYGIRKTVSRYEGRARVGLALRVLCLALILGVWASGTVHTFQDVPKAQAFSDSEGKLVDKLLSMGATRVFSEYWTCNRLTFRSEERVICSSVDPDLSPGFDRYAPYGKIVRAAPDPVYLFPKGSPHEKAWRAYLLEESNKKYRAMEFENYIFFIPD